MPLSEARLSASRYRVHTIPRLASLYVRRAALLINATADRGDGANPLFLYVAFAHTHTPLAYNARWSNSSTRPGWYKVGAEEQLGCKMWTRRRLLGSSPNF
jgi:hypothetical protein